MEPTAETPAVDPVSAAVRRLVTLFESHLSTVQFPGVDAAQLKALVDQVTQHTAEVERAYLALDAAQNALLEAQANLQKKAKQGLAYAKVFAETNEALAAELEEIVLNDKEKKAARARPKAPEAPEAAPEAAAEPTAEVKRKPGRPRKEPASA